MKPQKTILIVSPYFPPHGGGLERYAYEIASRLNKDHDWRVVVITSGKHHGKDVKEHTDGLTIYRLGYSWKFSNTPFSFGWFYKVKKILQAENPHSINIHMPVPGIGDVVSLLAGKIPTVITYHSGSMLKGKTLLDVPIWLYEHFALPILLHKASCIVYSSGFLGLGFLKRYTHKSTTITPAVDTDVFRPAPDKKTTYPSILFVAGIGYAEQHKGLQTLIDATKELQKTIPDIHLVVVGGGDMKTEYESRVEKLGLEKAVTFTGRLSGKELVEQYQRAHVFTLPSSNESFSMSILEAMACELPVVGTRVGGIPLLIDEGKTGFIISPKESSLLAKKIYEILTTPKQARDFGVAGRVKVVSNFGWSDRAKQYHNIFVLPAIVHVAPYYPPHTGGLERVAQMCAEEFANKGYQVEVITTTKSGLKRGTHIKNNLKVTTLWSFEFAHTPFAPTFLWHLFKIPRHSIIHLHLAQAYFPELVLLIAKLRGIPYVVHFHLDVGVSGILGPIFLCYKKLLWGPLMRNAAHVIGNASDQLETTPKKFHVSKDKLTIILNAVGSNFFTNHSYIPSTKNCRLLYVGRLSPQKRVDIVIKAVSKLSIPAFLTIVGNGEELPKLQALACKLKLTNVSFEGKKNDIEMQKYHSENDIFLISSDREGTALVVLEAMAGKLPVIGSDVTGIHELVDNVEVLVQEPYATNFARAIEDLWSKPEKLLLLSMRSLEKAKQYTWPRFIAQIEDVYKKVLK